MPSLGDNTGDDISLTPPCGQTGIAFDECAKVECLVLEPQLGIGQIAWLLTEQYLGVASFHEPSLEASFELRTLNAARHIPGNLL